MCLGERPRTDWRTTLADNPWDVESSTITILSPPSRWGETTQILGMERGGDHIILTGIEAGRGWSMVMAISDGDMTLTATDDGRAFIGRGKCVDAGLLNP